MTQDPENNKHFIADEGKIFRRVFNGFSEIENPYTAGTELILGEILIDDKGRKLNPAIEDKIEYYDEIDIPVEEEQPAEETTVSTEE